MHDTSHSLIPAKLPCLPPSVDWVVSRHEGWPGGGADGLHVVVLQGNPSLHQGVHVGSQDIAVVPWDIVEAWNFLTYDFNCIIIQVAYPDRLPRWAECWAASHEFPATSRIAQKLLMRSSFSSSSFTGDRMETAIIYQGFKPLRTCSWTDPRMS